MKKSSLALALATVFTLGTNLALAEPSPKDRVYTADQNTNTVSVINPATNTLLGQVRLGNQRPDVLSPLYKGEINVHGLGFSPDHKTLIARVPVGQAPQALVYVSNAVPSGAGTANLVPRGNNEPINIALKPTGGEAKGFVVARNLGVVDSLEVFLFKLKPQTAYNVYVSGQRTPVATFKTNPAGAANGTAIGPLREVVSTLSAKTASPANIFVIEGDATPDPAKAVLVSAQ
ncbi:MAG: hypothetical protein K2Y16_03250 [Burkholderiales bacterium]|nr:hypothetical protein [Burkholderiales bacterium]